MAHWIARNLNLLYKSTVSSGNSVWLVGQNQDRGLFLLQHDQGSLCQAVKVDYTWLMIRWQNKGSNLCLRILILFLLIPTPPIHSFPEIVLAIFLPINNLWHFHACHILCLSHKIPFSWKCISVFFFILKFLLIFKELLKYCLLCKSCPAIFRISYLFCVIPEYSADL